MYKSKKINVGISAGILSLFLNTACMADNVPNSGKTAANNTSNTAITSLSAEIIEKLAENMGVTIFKLPSGAYKVTIKQKNQTNEKLYNKMTDITSQGLLNLSIYGEKSIAADIGINTYESTSSITKAINNANTYTSAIAKSSTANTNTNINANANINTNINTNSTVLGQKDTVSEEKAEKKEPPAEQISPASGKAYVTGNGVNVRTGPGTDFNVIYGLNKGAAVELLGKYDNWYKIKLSNAVQGWMSADYISNEPPEISRGEEIANLIIDFAMQYMGVRYVYGGSSPSGFDCSGFTKYVYGNSGISIARVAADQSRSGAYIDKSSLMRGDLVFFDTDGGYNYINHVGIYIGNGQFIHASSGSGQVVISSLASGFYANTYMTGRRVIR